MTCLGGCDHGSCNTYDEYLEKAEPVKKIEADTGLSTEELQEMFRERDRERMIDAQKGDH